MTSASRPTPPAPRPVREPFSILLGLVLAAAFAVAYADVFAILVGQWSTNDVYSYGFLIPCISLYLVWGRRARVARAGTKPALVAGAIVLGAGLAVLMAGRSVGIVGLQELSIVITIAGIVLLVMGRAALRVLWFPIAYLLFMMPVWDIVTERLHYPFQLAAANLGSLLLRGVGIPVHQEGTFLELPNITLEVARVCSGVNYLIAVIAVGVPLAYVSFHDQGRRLVLIGFATLVAALANPVRVALIGLLSYYGLSVNVHGPWHVLQGLAVAMVGYAALFAGVWFLSRTPRARRGAGGESPPAVEGPPATRSTRPVLPAWPVAAAASLALIAAGSWRPGAGPEGVPSFAGAGRIPLEIGEWRGRDNLSPLVPASAGPVRRDDLWRIYDSPSGEALQLYVGRYARSDSRGGIDFWGGAIDATASRFSVEVPARSALEINRAVFRDGPRETQVLYWYDLGGRAAVSRVEAKLVYAWRRLTGSGGRPIIVVVLVSDAHDGRDRNRVLAGMSGFVRQLLPLLDSSLGR